jgi:hypothetical protein
LNVLTRFDGGPGGIAMRRPRRREPTRPLGTARSDGCIRVENAAIRFLATHVPDGSAVDII